MKLIYNYIKKRLAEIAEYLKKNTRAEIIMSAILIVCSVAISCNLGTIIDSKSILAKVGRDKFKGYTIVIDPGHGGVDPGKIGVNNILEKDVNLLISLYIEEKLKNAGADVILTRESDKGLYSDIDRNKKISDMRGRCEVINQAHQKNEKTLVVSIHQNSFTSENVSGAQVFYYKHSSDGKELATVIQNKFNDKINIGKQKQAKENGNYYMLLHTQCPTVIAECGFLSNWEEAQNLVQKTYQEQIATIVCEGILEYIQGKK